MYLATSAGMGFCKFVIKAVSCLHRSKGTQNDARPVGIQQGISCSGPSGVDGGIWNLGFWEYEVLK